MKYKILLFLFTLFFTTHVASAAPSLVSYTLSPSAISSGQLISLEWNAQDSVGSSLVVPCVPGIKVKKADGTLFPCDTKTSISVQEDDSQGFFVVNTSGVQRNVSFILYPKDSTGADTTTGQTKTVMVTTLPYPITSFTPSATSTITSSGVTLTWTAPELDGVNIQFACVDGVSVFQSGSAIALPCGQFVFSTKQGSSGSASFVFKNKNIDVSLVKVSLLPYVSDSTYDLTHAEFVTLEIASDKITPTQLLSFVATPPRIASDDNATLLWTTKYTNSINLKMDCVEDLSASFVESTGNRPVVCGKLLSETGFAPNAATTTFVFTNSTNTLKTAVFTLYPQLPDGGFDGTNTQKVSIAVYPKGQLPVQTVVVPVVQATSSVQNTTTGKKFVFTKLLKLKSKNSDVTELQKFLSKDSTLYPEASVTGYFGPATARAVGRFQVKYGLSKSGEAGYGQVGPKTREKLNAVQ
ncbi:MAG: hypothetical protein RL292_232 [Candidatus Parcubacteria bacterium]|jgi:hypothetical protein